MLVTLEDRDTSRISADKIRCRNCENSLREIIIHHAITVSGFPIFPVCKYTKIIFDFILQKYATLDSRMVVAHRDRAADYADECRAAVWS